MTQQVLAILKAVIDKSIMLGWVGDRL